MTTLKLSEYQALVRDYDTAYEAGLTSRICDFCEQPVVEKVASWEYYNGSGVVLHQHCVGHWMRNVSSADWWNLGFGLITPTWYVSKSADYMGLFMQCLGYGRWA